MLGFFGKEVLFMSSQMNVSEMKNGSEVKNGSDVKLFAELNLLKPLLLAVSEQGYETPTPIQAQAIGPLLEGRDMMGCAQTGTGKTAAFTLPILQKLELSRNTETRRLRVLVLAPTRELALQIAESFALYGKYTGVTGTVIFGGVGQEPQVRALRRGVDVLVATPGRLLDLMNQGRVSLSGIDTLVLDEADRMLDMGFVRDVEKILKQVPKQRQTMFFSATMAPEVVKLASGMLRDPVSVSVTPQATTVEKIAQSVYHVDQAAKRALLDHLLKDPKIERAIVFARTKHGADRIVRNLEQSGVGAEAIHGNKSQNARVRALDNFKDGKTRVLVATDIAARGIDVDGITHVINHDLPNVPDSYVHRIGRTARAGATGVAISFCAGDERALLRDIEKLIRIQVPVVNDHPFRSVGGSSSQQVQPSEARRPDPRNEPRSHDRGRGPARPAHGGQRGTARPGGNLPPSRSTAAQPVWQSQPTRAEGGERVSRDWY